MLGAQNQKQQPTQLKQIVPEINNFPQKQQNIYKTTSNRLNKLNNTKQDSLNVVDAKQKLDNLIQDLNGKLVSHFKMKQEALLNQYKQELIQQQKKLNALKNTTNQQQIKAKMLQRKAELERQRNHLIQTNMFFSQKCQQYKQTYAKLVQQSKQLQKQIQFLDNQIQSATSKRLSLLDEIGNVTQRNNSDNYLPIYTQKKASILPVIEHQSIKKQEETFQKIYGTHSVRKIAKSLHINNQVKNKKSNSVKVLEKIEKSTFDKKSLQKIFEKCVQEIKNRRKGKKQICNLKGKQFTELQKRAIMQIFLTNEQVKKKLYQIIFSDEDKNITKQQSTTNQKSKISIAEFEI